MGTTANNNWPTPVASDLVKDGWEAIKDLGDAIDTTLGVYVAAGGTVLQTIMGTNNTVVNTNSSAFTDTGTTATITPSSATNKVLVTVHQNGVGKDGSSGSAADIKLMRGATEIARPGTAAAYTQNTDTNYIGSVSISYLDEPATTSATTYKTQFNSGDNSGNTGVQKSSARSTIILQEIKI